MINITVDTKKKIDIVDITEKVKAFLPKHSGTALLFVRHTTAGILLNEYENNLKEDFERFFNGLGKGEWKHNTIDNNAEAHLVSSILGHQLVIPFSENGLELGIWQRILFVELDGPRKRTVGLIINTNP